MRLRQSSPIDRFIAVARSAVQAADTPGAATAPLGGMPFVTISRQAGAGGRQFALALVERLNALEPDAPPWTCWDRELVDKVRHDHSLRAEVIERLERRPPSWLEDLFAGLRATGSDAADDVRVFRWVATVIRAVALVGRAVIVGRSSGFITRDLRGGTHLRLVAPLEFRVRHTAEEIAGHAGAAHTVEAARQVAEVDQNRQAYHKLHWPDRPLIPENFTATFNVATTGTPGLVASAIPLLHAARQRTSPVKVTMHSSHG